MSGSAPLLGPDASATLPRCSDRDSVFSRASSSNGGPPLIMTSSRNSEDSGSRTTGKKSPSHHQEALKRRLEQTVVPEFPRHRLRMLTNLAEGAFGKLYVAEADGIPEYGSTKTLGKRFVAVKFLTHNASEAERVEFHREVRILAALEDPNIARVLGMCSREEPLCIVLEYLEHGDMRNFLASHVPAEANRTLPSASVAAAQGLKTLRNCLVGVGYLVKISDFGTDNEAYSDDYYRVEDNQVALPVRWMAWESLFLILTLGRRTPYEHLDTNEQVVDQLVHLRADDGQFCWLPRPPMCPRDLYDLMRECWRRVDVERPSFREIHLFLQRKNLGYAPV
ncbi:hypothetical protein B566_EDAN006487 [Ephemera danica]|nr:hypothetical protein B566_EDAN006487 [Ephemera danica]